MSLLHVMRGPNADVPFRTLCELPITEVEGWVSDGWARWSLKHGIDPPKPNCRTCWETIRRRTVESLIPKLGFRWGFAHENPPFIRDEDGKTVLVHLSSSYAGREAELLPLIAMVPEFHDFMAEAVERCESCRMLPPDTLVRCARCNTFLYILSRSRPFMPSSPAPTDVPAIVADPPETRADHGTYIIFSDPDGRSQWQGPFRRVRCAGRSLDVIRPDETDEDAWWTLAILLDPSNRWSVLEHEFESFRVEVRP